MIQETFARWIKSDMNQLPFPRTTLLNESWLLRLVLQWFSEQRGLDHKLGFQQEARWFSEARLPAPFPNEGLTRADGVIGHFDPRPGTKSGIKLRGGAKQLVVVEAKVGSKLSGKVTHAPDYDQAARTLACMAKLLQDGSIQPGSLTKLAFYVLAPQDEIEKGAFGAQLDREALKQRVRARAADQLDHWLRDWFEPVCTKAEIGIVSWEEILAAIKSHNEAEGCELKRFYKAVLCAAQPANRDCTHAS